MNGIAPEFLASYGGTSGGWNDPRIGLAVDLIEQAMLDAGSKYWERKEVTAPLVKLDEGLAERERQP